MPNALTEMYAQSLERIANQPESRCKRGRRILAWILKAYRPLSVDELLHALVVEECDEPPRQLDRNALVQPKVLLDVCAGLVTIERSNSTVRFIHATAHKFISELENEYLRSADRNILKACVNYMSFDAFSKGPSASDEDLDLRLRQYPFLTYSAQFWGRHLANIEDVELEKTTLTLLSSAEVTMAINQVAHLSNFKFPGYSQLFPKQVTPLHLVSSFGLLGMVVLFGAVHQEDLDNPDSFGWTALHRAAENGHEKIVKLLMEKGCDVNLATAFGGTALHRAAKNGHTHITTVLLGCEKILVDVPDNYGGTALHRAARDGHKMVAQMLLDNGADVNRKYSLIAALTMLKKNGYIDANATSRGYQYVDVWRSQDEAMARNEADITASERLQGGTALHEAAAFGDEGVIKLLLQSGAIVDALDNFGATPLHRAAYSGHVETIRLLLQHGSHLDHSFYHRAVVRETIEKKAYRERHREWKAKDWVFRNMAGSPLRQAIKNGQEQAVRLLLSYDPNSNVAGQLGGSILHQAAQSGHTEIVKLLLERGADVDTVDESSATHRGETALHSAAEGGHLEVVRTLLKAGANVNKCRGIGASHATPLLLAVKGGHEALCLLLLHYGAETDPGVDHWGTTPFEEAAKQGNMTLIQLLLNHGAEKIDKAAGQAAAKGELEIVKTMLQNGADPNRKMIYPSLPTRNERVTMACPYETILGAAVSSADIATIDLLLSVGANPNMAWPWGKRPLLLAIGQLKESKEQIYWAMLNAQEADLQAAYGKKDEEFEAVVQLLLQKGADVTGQDNERNTPLHLAARHGFVGLVAIFLAAGANVNVLNSDRESPLFLAATNGHLPTLQLLLDAGARVEDGLSPLYKVASEEAAQLLLRHGAEIHELDGQSAKALITAASKGVESVAKTLLEKGENVETTNEWGQTALFLAVENGRLEAARVLLDHGADMESKCRGDRETPLVAAVDPFRGTETVALLLVERGADINVQYWLYKRSVLGMAAISGMETLVRTLLDHGLPIDFVDKNGCTPLNLAASNGHNGVVQFLLQNGAKVDFTGYDSDFSEDSCRRSRATPLSVAAQNGHTSTVRLLADAGAEIFGRTPDRYHDPFVGAASTRNLGTLKALLNIYIERKSGRTIEDADQSERQDQDSAQQIVGTPIPDDTRLAVSLSAALEGAVNREDLETVRFLLQEGAKLSDDVKSFTTPFRTRRSLNRSRMSVAIYSALLDAGVAFNFEEVFHNALDKAELALAQRLLPKLRLSAPPCPRADISSSYAADTFYGEPIQALEGTPLSHAAEAGYEELVQQLLDAGFDPDAAIPSETKTCSALTLAAENGHVAIVELLWRGEAKTKFLTDPAQFLLGSEYERICALVAQDIPDPNSTSESGERLLHRAAANGHTRAIQILLSRGADPRIPTTTTLQTPLHCAVRSRNPAVLQLLFAHGAKPDIEALDGLGRTPLSYAAEGGCNAVAKFLLQQNAKTDTHSNTYPQPLNNEKKKKSRWDRSPLPRHAVLEQPNLGGFAPLHYAASMGQAATVILLLSHGAAVDARDAIGRTPLMLASGDGARGAAQQLLDHGADPAAIDDQGRTPLHHAAKGGWRGIAQLLLDTGKIDPGARDGEEKTALHHAAMVRSVGVARVLLSKRLGVVGTGTTAGSEPKLDPNARDARGWTALHEAVEESDNEMVIVLVRCPEVDPAVKNNEGEAPLAMARKGYNREVKDTLERRLGIESVDGD